MVVFSRHIDSRRQNAGQIRGQFGSVERDGKMRSKMTFCQQNCALVSMSIFVAAKLVTAGQPSNDAGYRVAMTCKRTTTMS